MIEEILDQMADQIRSGVAGADLDIQVEPGMVLFPTPPTIDIFPGQLARGTEARAFGDIDGELLVTVRVRVQPNDYDANQSLLLEFMDETSDLSLMMALFSDETLAGRATSIDIRASSGFQIYPLIDNSGAHIGCQWDLLVTPVFS